MLKKFLLFFLSLLVFIGPFASCSSDSRQRYESVYTDVFDTVTQLTVYCNSQKEFDSLSETVHNELLRLHQLFDIYNHYEGVQNLFDINSSSNDSFAEIDPAVSELILLGKEMYSTTDGALNVGMGSVLSVWHQYREEGNSVPAKAMLTEAYQNCNLDSVSVNGNNIQITDSHLKFDFGAVAKGYAADRLSDLIKKQGYVDFALNIGGNVITSGTKLGKKWRIGVENPDGGVLTTLSVSDVSVVTSGDYQRYYEVDGIKYHHIIDPVTLFPAERYHSVSVICSSSSYADALSTALFCLPIEKGKALAEKYHAEVLWVTVNNELIRTDGFKSYEE